MSNIFVTSEWTDTDTYSKFAIVSVAGLYYYSKVDNNLNQSPEILNSAYWGGIITYNGVDTPHFYWKPTYNSPLDFEPKMLNIQFGDGYSQRVPMGINNNLLMLNLNFEGTQEAETAAITHFLYQRQGTKSFIYTPLSPFAQQKRFICKKWSVNPQFKNNYNITATFDEVAF